MRHDVACNGLKYGRHCHMVGGQRLKVKWPYKLCLGVYILAMKLKETFSTVYKVGVSKISRGQYDRYEAEIKKVIKEGKILFFFFFY